MARFNKLFVKKLFMPDGKDKGQLDKLTQVTATASELNIMDGVTATTAEINALAGVSDALEWTYGTAIATTEGTSQTLVSGLADTFNTIEVILNAVSTSAINQCPIIRLGDSGGVEATGYAGAVVGTSGTQNPSTSFQTFHTGDWAAGDNLSGILRLTRWDSGAHLWLAQGMFNNGAEYSMVTMQKTVSAALTSVTLTTPGGAATFDNGSARVRYK